MEHLSSCEFVERVLKEAGEQWAKRTRLRRRGADLRWFIDKVAVGVGGAENLKGEQITLSKGNPCCSLLHGAAGGRIELCFSSQGT